MKKWFYLWLLGLLALNYGLAWAQLPGALLWKTGQTISYVLIEKNDDGAFPRGVTWPNPRFTDHNDGTVTDNLTGLMWLKDSGCFPVSSFSDSLANIQSFNRYEYRSSCHSYTAHFNDWRLPNIIELRSLIDYSQTNPAIKNDHPFSGVKASTYWSSTPYSNLYMWLINFQTGEQSAGTMTSQNFMWLVRNKSIHHDHSDTFVSPTCFAFSSQNETKEFFVKNTGTSDLIIHSIDISYANDQSFSIQSNTCNNETLLPNTTCTIAITFQPQTYGLKKAHLILKTNDPDTPETLIQLSGAFETAYPSNVNHTGQLNEYYANDDGHFKRGVHPPNTRFVDNEDGTITDQFTQLMWFKNASCLNKTNWHDALSLSSQINESLNAISNQNCGVSTTYANWRLPNKNELMSLIDFSAFNPALNNTHLFQNVHSEPYWSATPFSGTHTWTIDLKTGELTSALKAVQNNIWLVRSIHPDNWYPKITLSQPSHDFGKISVNQTSSPFTFTIRNEGQRPLIIDTLIFNNSRLTPDFEILNDHCSGESLPFHETCSFDIIYTPQSEGEKNQYLTIPSNDQDTPLTKILLRGITDLGVFAVGVAKTGFGSGDIIFNPVGYVCDRHCTFMFSMFEQGSVVTLSFSPSSGSVFRGWSGYCQGIGDCTITVSEQTSVWAKVDHQYVAPALSTGQTESYAAKQKHDDGEMKRGIKWHEQSPNDKRLKDQSDGTIVDQLTGLMWLKNASCLGQIPLNEAITRIDEFNQNPMSFTCYAYQASYNDWRLPNINELKTLIDYSNIHPSVTNNVFTGLATTGYWSSTPYSNNLIWQVNLDNGDMSTSSKTTANHVLLVRKRTTDQFSDIQVNPNRFEFATPEQRAPFIVSNVGNKDLTLYDTTLSGTYLNDFKVVYNTCSNQTLIPGDRCTIHILFRPQSIGYKTAQLNIQSNDQETSIYKVPLIGHHQSPKLPQTGEKVISYSVRYQGDDGALKRGAAVPENRFIDHSDGTVTDRLTQIMWLKHANCFDTVNLTQALDKIELLNNAPDQAACHGYRNTYSDWRLPNHFELKSLIDYSFINPAISINHTFCDIKNAAYVTQTPFSNTTMWSVNFGTAEVTAQLKTSGLYAWPMRYITQTGNYPELFVSPNIYTFGKDQISTTIAVQNTGNAPLVISHVELTGMNHQDYQISNESCEGQSINISQTCLMTITFTPHSSGLKRAAISILSNDSDTPNYSVPLIGYKDTPQPAKTLHTGQQVSYYQGDDANTKRGYHSQLLRFKQPDDNTIVDNTTGLMWMKHANCIAPSTFKNALESIVLLNSGNHGITCLPQQYQDWRLPNKNELHSLIDFAMLNPALPANHLFSNLELKTYWSSTPGSNTECWIINMANGEQTKAQKNTQHYVLAVRSTRLPEDQPKLHFTPSSLSFDSIQLGQSSNAQSIEIQNQGKQRLVIDTANIIGSHTSQFHIMSDNCSGQILPYLSTCSISLIFSPLSNGTKQAQLAIKSNDQIHMTAYAPLNGSTHVKQYMLTVLNKGIGHGMIESTPQGILCGEHCKYNFDEGTIITLNAIIGEGSVFKGWYGDYCNQSTEACTFELTSNVSLTADISLPQPAPIWKTGQTQSYAVEYQHDDGAVNRGVGLPVIRFTDNSDGTVTDNLTGLMWLKHANCLNSGSWKNAFDNVDALNTQQTNCYAYNQSYHDWRVPNINELKSLIDYAHINPAISEPHYFVDLKNDIYWSSTPFSNTQIWRISFSTGDVSTANQNSDHFILPVRGHYSPLSKGNIHIEPLTYHFNHKEQTSQFVLSNTGNEDLIFSSILLSDQTSFKIISDGCSMQSLAYSSSCVFDIQFIPENQGYYHAQVKIMSNDPDNPEMTIQLSGSYQRPQPVQLSCTGQKVSYAERYEGDDGAYQRGIPVPDPSFIIHSDGTATDQLTHLMWLIDASCFGAVTWEQAIHDIRQLNYQSHESHCHGYTNDYTNWRLPNVQELKRLINYANNNPALSQSHPFAGLVHNTYWTQTPWSSTNVWQVHLGTGEVTTVNKTSLNQVIVVRTIEHAFDYPDIRISPSTFHFGEQNQTQLFKVENTNDSPLSINMIRLAQPNAKEFIIKSDTCSNKTITDTCYIEVMFSPNQPGAKHADIVISSNDPDSPNYLVPISGNSQITLPTQVIQTGQDVGFSPQDDGNLKRGFPRMVQRYIKNNDGTTSDQLTGLMWLTHASCMGSGSFKSALSRIQELNEHAAYGECSSAYHDWRLPNKNELLGMIDYSQSNPAIQTNNPFIGLMAKPYWSSTSFSNTHIWTVNMSTGDLVTTTKSDDNYIWAVRTTHSNTYYPDLSATPIELRFNAIEKGTMSPMGQILLSNKGDKDLSITDIQITGQDATHFMIRWDNCTGQIISDMPCSISVVFYPMTNGKKVADIAVFSNDQQEHVSHIHLSGTTIVPQYKLEITKKGTGTGHIESNQQQNFVCDQHCEVMLDKGTAISLSMIPGSGTIFQGWEGGGCSGTGFCDVVMNKNIHVLANLNLPQPAIIPETGQEISYAKQYLGDDGALKRGVCIPEPRFVSHSDGTVIDHLTGLMWMRHADCFGSVSWAEAFTQVNDVNAGLDQGCYGYANQYSDWRLPNISELKSVLDYKHVNPAVFSNYPFSGLHHDYYWTSTPYQANTIWRVHIGTGEISTTTNKTNHYVWLVRSGHGAYYSDLSLSPVNIHFAETNVNRTITIASTGNQALTIQQIKLMGPNQGAFSIIADLCSNKKLDPGDTCSVHVQFSPSSTGNQYANIDIPSNDIDMPLSKVYLSGQFGLCQTAAINRTGQEDSYAVRYQGDDGALKRGVLWSSSDRFIDNDDGTVIDQLTGLQWLKNANCFAKGTWKQALDQSNAFNQSPEETGCITQNDDNNLWRLPQVNELKSLIHYAKTNPSISENNPFLDIQNDYYWTSTSFSNTNIWRVHMTTGEVSSSTKSATSGIWLVKSINTFHYKPSIYVAPDQHDFGHVTIQTFSHYETIRVTNTSQEANLMINTIALSGGHVNQFDITGDGCSRHVLSINDMCEIHIAFHPTSTGDKTSYLMIPSNDPASDIVAIQLKGTGTDIALIRGDLNKDGIVNLKDAFIALQVISKVQTDQSIFVGAEINDDSKIGIVDAIIIMKHIANEQLF